MSLAVTLDLDWACESAIEETLDFLQSKKIIPTVFATHRSARVESVLDSIEVGLHPYFSLDSSHGRDIDETVKHVLQIPHNLAAFRCHRYATCNNSKQAMSEAGMLISSNVCTDLEYVPPFKDRFGFLEIPIFLEDGGYLWRKHPLEMHTELETRFLKKGVKVIVIHPMHFALNTPHFDYMYKIKQSMNREAWKSLNKEDLAQLRWKGLGVRDLLTQLLEMSSQPITLGKLWLKSHNSLSHQLE